MPEFLLASCYSASEFQGLSDEARRLRLGELSETLSSYVRTPKGEKVLHDCVAQILKALATLGHLLEEYDYDGSCYYYGRKRSLELGSDLTLLIDETHGVRAGWDEWEPWNDDAD